MLRIPQSCIHTRSTPFWNKDTAPAGIFQRHLDKGTRQGVYPRLSVHQGPFAILALPRNITEPESELIIKPVTLACSRRKNGITSKQ
jgi:tellurite resistance-related uncharacterized protein